MPELIALTYRELQSVWEILYANGWLYWMIPVGAIGLALVVFLMSCWFSVMRVRGLVGAPRLVVAGLVAGVACMAMAVYPAMRPVSAYPERFVVDWESTEAQAAAQLKTSLHTPLYLANQVRAQQSGRVLPSMVMLEANNRRRATVTAHDEPKPFSPGVKRAGFIVIDLELVAGM